MSRLERTHWWYKSTHELVEACVRRFASPGEPLFDAGCGTGGLLKTLSKIAPVSGCDTSDLSVRLARKLLEPKSRLNIQKSGIEELHRLKARSFECVTCIDVLYHQQVRNWRDALQNLKRLLKPHGHLILQVAAFSILQGSHDIAVNGARRFRRYELESALKDSGFTPRLCSYRYSHLFPLLLARRLKSRLEGSEGVSQSDFETASRVPESVKSLIGKIALSIARVENVAVLKGVSMPFGSSLFLVARNS